MMMMTMMMNEAVAPTTSNFRSSVPTEQIISSNIQTSTPTNLRIKLLLKQKDNVYSVTLLKDTRFAQNVCVLFDSGAERTEISYEIAKGLGLLEHPETRPANSVIATNYEYNVSQNTVTLRTTVRELAKNDISSVKLGTMDQVLEYKIPVVFPTQENNLQVGGLIGMDVWRIMGLNTYT